MPRESDTEVLRPYRRRKKPKEGDSSSYLGIEIECIIPAKKKDMAEVFNKYSLSDRVMIGDDGSISGLKSKEHPFEFRILVPQQEARNTLRSVCKGLKKAGARVNSSCGLHVHIDMRHRDPRAAYRRLFKAGKFLFSCVPEGRKNSFYCRPNHTPLLKRGDFDDRYSAINPHALDEHKTLEVRLHPGTTQYPKIANWCELLLAIADGPDLADFPTTVKDVGKCLELRTPLVRHFAERIAKFHPKSSFLKGSRAKSKPDSEDKAVCRDRRDDANDDESDDNWL